MNHREEHLALCAGYAIGALDEAERRVLEQHLAEGCPDCEAELRRLGDGVTALAASAPPYAPPPALKARVLERVRTEGVDRALRAVPQGSRVLPLKPRRAASLTWVWAAAAGVLAATSVGLWRITDRLNGELVAARQSLDTQRQELAEKDRQLTEQQRWSDMLGGAGTRVVDMKLTPQGNAVLKARAIYDPQSRRAMIVFTNFTPPVGSDYELWALRDGKPASLGVIHPDASGRAMMKLGDTGDPAHLGAFAVSLEKAGGSSSRTAPDGPVVMVGMLGGS